MTALEIAISFLYRQIPLIGKAEAVKACAWVFPGLNPETLDGLAENLLAGGVK